MLSLESTGARMNRLGSEILAGVPLLSLDEIVERIDAVTLDDLARSSTSCGRPSACRRPASGPTESASSDALAEVEPALVETRVSTIRVAVAGAAGRMGETVCGAVEGADDMELVARADPALGMSLADALAQRPDVLVDFTVPRPRSPNAREAVAAGVHVVIGTTGFDPAELEGLSGANVFVAPNFAIGAVLMMQFAAEAARHMARAEIIELHHDRKVDAPSGTAARTAALMREAARSTARCRSTRSGCRGSWPTRR